MVNFNIKIAYYFFGGNGMILEDIGNAFASIFIIECFTHMVEPSKGSILAQLENVL